MHATAARRLVPRHWHDGERGLMRRNDDVDIGLLTSSRKRGRDRSP